MADTILKFPDNVKLKIVKFALKHFNNFNYNGYIDCKIKVNQSIPSNVIIEASVFADRNKLKLTIEDKTLIFKNPLNE